MRCRHGSISDALAAGAAVSPLTMVSEMGRMVSLPPKSPSAAIWSRSTVPELTEAEEGDPPAAAAALLPPEVRPLIPLRERRSAAVPVPPALGTMVCWFMSPWISSMLSCLLSSSSMARRTFSMRIDSRGAFWMKGWLDNAAAEGRCSKSLTRHAARKLWKSALKRWGSGKVGGGLVGILIAARMECNFA